MPPSGIRFARGKTLANWNNYNGIRLVAGGFRIFKTSKADVESGVLNVAYASRGANIRNSLKDFVEDPNNK